MDARISSRVWTSQLQPTAARNRRGMINFGEEKADGKGGREGENRPPAPGSPSANPTSFRPHQAACGFAIASVWQGLVTLALPNDIWAG